MIEPVERPIIIETAAAAASVVYWGSICGDLSDQADLRDALAAKADAADLGALAGKDTADWDTDIDDIPESFPPSSHTHAAGNITSGTLPVERGGTGVDTTAKNKVFSGPSTGDDAAPSFRKLEAADIPSLPASKIGSGILNTSRGGTGTDYVSRNYFFAGPATQEEMTTYPRWRKIVVDDIPNLAADKITSGTLDVGRIPSLSASKITSGTLGVARGGTGYGSVDDAPTSGSAKMVKSGGVYTALAGKANTADLGALAGKDTADWTNDVSGKPASFPPEAHTHDYTTDLTNVPASFPPEAHNHDDLYYGKSYLDDKLADTGWIDFTNTTNVSGTVYYRLIGGSIVCVRATNIKLKSTLAADSNIELGRLPTAARPSYTIYGGVAYINDDTVNDRLVTVNIGNTGRVYIRTSKEPITTSMGLYLGIMGMI